MSRFIALLCATSLCISACDSTDTDFVGSVDLSLATASGTAPQGGSIGAVATVIRDGGFEGTVSFGVSGAPTGVTVAVNGIDRNGETTTALVTLAIAADAVPGTYPLTVTALGDGVDDAESFALTISAVTAPNYSINVLPRVVTVVGGQSGPGSVALVRTGGFVGVVHLSLSGAPTGVTATFTPTDLSGSTGTMAINVPASATPGVYSVFVTGTAGGFTDKSYPFTLVVKDPSTVSVVLSAPLTASVHQGATTTAALTLIRTGSFEGEVTFTATGMPAGMSLTFDPASSVASASVATITVSSTTATGSYPVVIHANASGIDEATATIMVTVTP